MNKWADLWESHVRAGKTPEQATALVQQAQQDEAYKPTGPKIAAESTLATRDKAPQRADRDLSMITGTARQVGQGATFGFADEIEAGARRVLPLSPNDHGKSYEDIRNGIRDDNQQFTQDHPYVAIGANVAGGALTGGALLKAAKSAPVIARTLSATGLVPKAEATATLGQRIGAGMKAGAAAGTLSGAGVANEKSDMLESAALGGVGGLVAGGLFSGGAELIRGGRNLIAGAGQSGASGPIRRAIQSESPEQSGARRVLATMGRAGQSLDDVAAESATTDNAALAELVKKNHGVSRLRIARNVGRERDVIDQSLAERAAEEPANWSRTITRETGVQAPRDPQAFATEAADEARKQAAPLYEQSQHLATPDGATATMLKGVRSLSDDGLNLWSKARLADPTFPKEITDELTVGQLQRLRQVLDDHINYGENPLNMNSIERAAQGRLRELRGQVDEIAKAAGGESFQQADATMAKGFAKGQSFGQGSKVDQAGTAEGVQRMASEARDPEAFRQGAASQLLKKAADTADGEAGQVRNPIQAPLASETRRARTRAAFADDASFERAREDAAKITNRLRTKQAVSGNSTTAANLSEMADEFMSNPGQLLSATVNPMSLPRVVAERVLQGGLKGINAAQATEMGKLLGAGLPGQMTREEAIAILRRMEPALVKQLERQLVTRGATSGAAVRQIGGNGR